MDPSDSPVNGSAPVGGGESAFTEACYREYIAAFNRGDFAEFPHYYTADVEFQGRNGLLRGRQAITDFYRQVRSRLRERIEIRQLVVGQGELLADLVTHLEAFEDWPELPSGAMAKGDTRRSENFVWYDLRGRQFSRVRSAHLRKGADLMAEPIPASAPASGSGISADDFARYIDAFNRDDFATVSEYYAPDVTLGIAGKVQLVGRQAILDFYRSVKAQTRRTIEVNRVICAPHALAAELQSEFVALRDLPEFTAGPMRKDQRIFINTFVLYELREGRFARIRSAELRKIRRP